MNRIIFAGLFGVSLAAPLHASGAEQDKKPDRQSMIKMHEKMAERHKAAADCLRTNRSLDDCRREAMKDCPMMDSGMCPFMENMGMMHKRMMGRPEKRPKGGERSDTESEKKP